MKLTPKQAGQRAGVSASLIYRWCEQWLLPHFRFGGRGSRGKIMIEDVDLDAFMARMRVEAMTPEQVTSIPPRLLLRRAYRLSGI